MTLSPAAWLAALDRLRRRRLVSNASIYVLGTTLQRALGFLLIPLYTRYLTPSDYGITGVATAAEGVLTAVLGLGIASSISRYYFDFRQSPERLKQFISATFLFLALVAAAGTLALQRWGEGLWTALAGADVAFWPYVVIVLWISYAGLLFQVPLSLFTAQQRARAFVAAQLLNFLLTLAATMLFVVAWRMGAVGQLLGRLVGVGVSAGLLSLLLLAEWFSRHLRWSDVRLALAFGLPLIPHLLLGWAMNLADRFLLAREAVPLAEIGRYTLGYQIGLGMAILVASINLAWSPYYYNLMAARPDPEARIGRIFSIYVAALGGVCLVGVLFNRELLQLIAPPRYFPAAQYVPLILFAYLLNGYYFFATMPLFYYRKTPWISSMTTAAALLNIGLNLWWIPLIGAMGSAWATVAAFAAVLLIGGLLGRRLQPIPMQRGALLLANGLIFAGVLVATYAPLLGGPILGPLGRLGLLGIFGVTAYLTLVQPNVAPLRAGA